MFLCKICDVTIWVENIHPSIPALFSLYPAEPGAVPDIVLEVTRAEIDDECSRYPDFNAFYHEFVLLFKKLVPLLLQYDIFFFHSAVVSYNNEGYIFTGRSGSGKSTHALLWQKHLNAEVINGDKPLFRLLPDGFYAYGNPWSGKEGLHKNSRVRVKAAAFIEQGQTNSIQRLSSGEVLSKLFNQTVYMSDPELNEKLLALLDKFLTDTPFYLLTCNISGEAVKTAYNAMKEEN